MTLGDYKEKTLKQLGSWDSALNGTDDEDILNRFNDVINKAVRFVFYGKSALQIWHIIQGKSPNMIMHQDEIYTHMDEDISFIVPKAYSYYFEVDDEAIVEISQNGVVVDTITHTATTGERILTAKKGAITGADGSPITITFKGAGYYNFKNIALYGAQFSSEDRIPDFNIWVPNIIPANLQQIRRVLLSNGDSVNHRVIGNELLIPYDITGDISVESTYFPAAITSATLDTYEIDVPTENEEIIVDKACALLTQKSQSYQDYTDDVDQGMGMLDTRKAVATARVVKLINI